MPFAIGSLSSSPEFNSSLSRDGNSNSVSSRWSFQPMIVHSRGSDSKNKPLRFHFGGLLVKPRSRISEHFSTMALVRSGERLDPPVRQRGRSTFSERDVISVSIGRRPRTITELNLERSMFHRRLTAGQRIVLFPTAISDRDRSAPKQGE